MYCEKCGKETLNEKQICDECDKNNVILSYISVALAILGIILPFIKWLEVPVAQGLYSMFGMAQETPTFSLFGYIFAGSQYQSGIVYAITMILALVALIGIIFNVIYVVKTFKKKEKIYKYGSVGSGILTIVSAVFIVIVGLSAMILKVIKLTATPYITLAVSIANLIVIKKMKRGNTK